MKKTPHSTIKALLTPLVKLCLLATLMMPCAALHAQVNAEQVMTIGRNVLAMDDYLLSIQYFNLAIKAKPYLADPYYLRGLAKLNLDDFEGAVADCSQALAINKFRTEAYKVRGFSYQRLGKDSLAVEDYIHGLEYDPTDKYFLFYKGVAETELKRFGKADTTLTKLRRLHPAFEEGWTASARLDMARGDTLGAIGFIDHALKLSKTLVPAYLMKAEIYAKQENWKQSLENMDEAIRIQPDEPDFYINRAYLRYNNEDFFGAMSDYNYTLDIDPDNEMALFNRALLRFQVKELQNAYDDFSKVLQMQPDNFHALYNRGLVALELDRYKTAEKDFNRIVQKYPRFHPAYYALAECARQQGNLRLTAKYIKKGEELVAKYVSNPEKNPLDRPTIAAGNNAKSQTPGDDEDETEIMERFNQLVTASNTGEGQMSFNDRIKGRVQDRNQNVQLLPSFAFTYFAPGQSLKSLPDSFRDLDAINSSGLIGHKVYLAAKTPSAETENEMAMLLAIENTAGKRNKNKGDTGHTPDVRPVDFFALGVAQTGLGKYREADEAFAQAAQSDAMTAALFGRAFAQFALATKGLQGDEADPSMRNELLRQAAAQLDAVLLKNPANAYAWYNKGIIYHTIGDYTSALGAFGKALDCDPTMGEAYYNRGLAYLGTGHLQLAFRDLSKAGEAGIIQAYNLMKRLKNKP